MPLGAAKLLRYGSAVSPTGLPAIDTNDSFYANGTTLVNNTSAVRTITISFWLQHRSTDEDVSGEQTVFNLIRSDGTSNLQVNYQGGRIRFINRNTGGVNNFAYDYTNGTFNSGVYGDGTWDTGNWNHFVFSWNGSTSSRALYVNGISQTLSVLSGRENYSLNGWEGTAYDTVRLFNESGAGSNTPSSPIAQIAIWTQWYDLNDSAVRAKFYNGGALNLGDGTLTGLDRPIFYHTGNSNAILSKRGLTANFNYSLSSVGTAIDISPSLGPQLGA